MKQYLILNEATKKGGIKATREYDRPPTKEYRACIVEANKNIEEVHRRYADAYQKDSSFLVI